MGQRGLIRASACVIVALSVLVVPVLADELIGRITAVNIDAKKLTVKEKGTDKDIEVIVNDETVVEKGKSKAGKVNLEKMQKAVEKAKDGIPVEITHDKGTASKIVYKNAGKKKTETPKTGETKKDTGK